MTTLSAPHLDYWALAPILILLGGALLSVLAEAFLAHPTRKTTSATLAFGSIAISFITLIERHQHTTATAAVGSVSFDPAGIFFQGMILVLGFAALVFMANRDQFVSVASALPGSNEEAEAIKAGRMQSELFPLALFALSGALLFVVATDLITLFVALELLSLPLYLMVGLSRRRRLLSQEAALKYFLLGAFASAIFLFGSALLYGFSNSLSLVGIDAALSTSTNNNFLFILGLVFVLIGLLFKTGTAPFHSWVPDVYQGAPTPITGFMASIVKIAAFGAFLRIFYAGFGLANTNWRPLVIAVAIVSMFVGSIGAVVQRDIKRILAYSSIAHSGFLTMAVVSLSGAALQTTLFYLFTYGVATVGIFGTITLVKDSVGEVGDINRWSGLAKKSPLVAIVLTIFLLSFTGIPLTAGFVAKFSLFTSVLVTGYWWLIIPAVVASAIAAYAYLKVLIQIFFSSTPSNTVSVEIPSLWSALTIGLAAITTLVLGIYPNILSDFVSSFSTFIR
jgi:NADH-quinone oxidoreductase subunit N